MKTLDTPIYIKRDESPWPDDPFCYVLAREGLFRCRNHPFFQSCVKVKEGPKDLASQEEFLRLSYPKIPRKLVEQAVGFFQLVADKQNSEAAVIFAWNATAQQVEMIVPDQIGINSSPSSFSPRGYPLDVKYQLDHLPPGRSLIGDMHCHVDGSAYASFTDENDELHRPGIHIIVGHIGQEPPQFYCDAVADGSRFKVSDLDLVIEGYEKRRLSEVPLEWLDQVKLEIKSYPAGSSGVYGGYGSVDRSHIRKSDKDKIQTVLSRFMQWKKKPEFVEVRQALYAETELATFAYCEERAEKFLAAWEKQHENA